LLDAQMRVEVVSIASTDHDCACAPVLASPTAKTNATAKRRRLFSIEH
jgi:hypothetical protein